MANDQNATVTSTATESGREVAFRGRLDAQTLPSVWSAAFDPLRASPPSALVIRLEEVSFCDGAGIGLLVELDRQVRGRGGTVTFEGLKDDLRRILDMALLKDPAATLVPGERRPGPIEQIGRSTALLLDNIRAVIEFTGEMLMALLWALRHPRHVRMRDMWAVAGKAGVNALPVVCLLGFLIGLIIAFQCATPMRQFGAETLVPMVVGVAVIRELGPLMAAIILAGRSGSAFAAEIGTMKVTEELDALNTFGLDPTRFLVVPRVLAALIVTPLLALFSSLLGIVGGYVVMASLGYSLAFYVNAIISAVDYVDLLQGEFKAIIFALLVAAIGCLRGLRTQSGPGAVGDSTTKAVVAGIVLIVLADAVLGVMFFSVGL